MAKRKKRKEELYILDFNSADGIFYQSLMTTASGISLVQYDVHDIYTEIQKYSRYLHIFRFTSRLQLIGELSAHRKKATRHPFRKGQSRSLLQYLKSLEIIVLKILKYCDVDLNALQVLVKD